MTLVPFYIYARVSAIFTKLLKQKTPLFISVLAGSLISLSSKYQGINFQHCFVVLRGNRLILDTIFLLSLHYKINPFSFWRSQLIVFLAWAWQTLIKQGRKFQRYYLWAVSIGWECSYHRLKHSTSCMISSMCLHSKLQITISWSVGFFNCWIIAGGTLQFGVFSFCYVDDLYCVAVKHYGTVSSFFMP